MRRKDLVPDTITISILIDGLCKLGRISCASKLLVEMHDKGQPADIITYNSFLDALCKNHHVDKALVLFNTIKDQGIRPNICYCPNVWTYTIMINGLCKEGLLHEALACLSKMEDNGRLPNAVTYEIIICALFKKGENDNAEKLLREMISRGLLQGEKESLVKFLYTLVIVFHSFHFPMQQYTYSEDRESLWTCICDTNGFSKAAVGVHSSSCFNLATAPGYLPYSVLLPTWKLFNAATAKPIIIVLLIICLQLQLQTTI
ncbi:Pentatricopeptide repeat-containing protein [Arachis hypogaea]|nr:Pentatricopeptide repeat-containing protein [Arachis hypogaea]